MAPAELLSDPIFAGISPKFLLWQQGLVISKKLKPGDVLCRQGDAGNTAFLIKSGRLEVSISPKKNPTKGILGRFLPQQRDNPVTRFQRTPEALIIGEMACMTGTPRTASVKALAAGEVWEVRRNVLDRLMRLPTLKRIFEATYRDRVLGLVLRESELFENLDTATFDQVVKYLSPRISFVRVSPGQILFEQGQHHRIASFGGF